MKYPKGALPLEQWPAYMRPLFAPVPQARAGASVNVAPPLPLDQRVNLAALHTLAALGLDGTHPLRLPNPTLYQADATRSVGTPYAPLVQHRTTDYGLTGLTTRTAYDLGSQPGQADVEYHGYGDMFHDAAVRRLRALGILK